MKCSFPSETKMPGPSPSSRRAIVLSLILLIVLTTAAYWTSFRGALVFDDVPGIANNPTIRDLSRPELLLVAIGPQGGTLSGRPVPNLTLALNHAISGTDLWSYHTVNLLIHLLAGMTLFGLIRRTLLLPSIAEKLRLRASSLALAVAALWSLHPLQTESVTYLVQRVESLMALFYLLTLYCFARSLDSTSPRRWLTGSWVACLIGMGCKEVMVTAPLVVFLYDRTFAAASWSEPWRRRRFFYVALLSTWILLGALVIASGGRGGTAGFGLEGRWWRYALTQPHAILSYLKLSIWPHPLIFDHNLRWATSLSEVWAAGLAVVALLFLTLWLLIRRPALGFLGAAFFLILAPTSSVVPVADAMFEHRMYLPLAAVMVLVVLGLNRVWENKALPLALGLAFIFGGLTARRNLDYADPLGLWNDVIQKLPTNARAYNNAGGYLLDAGRTDEARRYFENALKLDPNYASPYYNLGHLFETAGKSAEAIEAYTAAARLNPKRDDALVSLAMLLDQLGRPAEAIPHFEAALQIEPDASEVHAALGGALLKLKRPAPALDHLQTALRLDPTQPTAWHTLARLHQQQGDLPAARRAVERALQLKPNFPEALYLLGNFDAAAGDFPAAIARFQKASDLAPGYFPARNNLANALLLNGQIDAAIAQYRQILRDRPDDRAVQENLARALELRRP